ncbi:cadherin repeat domain-containing protein [Cyanobium sp. FACHB-13342]|uniref:cadherin repeat domain-containing protein n=1 Tax=Cyanobium sp. FACHB-13342 TaxID=2692793 RepID=UPI0016815D03|nr:cadherin repeat domain-containing protein [Cyanobium sp. FACHB-13342]MBD2423084.1 cadherin repeat domain-containing protein [Cyanobium sp. FACHB-13342]
MATTWTFGSEGSALWFTISINDSGLATVEMLAGSMDLNALWFSDGDATPDGSTSLTKTQTSLNMNGSGSLDAEGNLITWDEVTVLSTSGLGKLGTTKTTYLTAGEEQTFTLDAGTLAFLDSFKEESEGSEGGTYDFSSLTLGVRATSVNGGDSVKLNAVADVDDTAPVVGGDQSFDYAENQSAGAEVGQVQATDDVAVTQYRFADSEGTTSADGYYQIDSTGKITITAAGVAAGVANNDYETTPNQFTYGIQAGDATDNWSESVDVTLNVTDLDDGGGGGSEVFVSYRRFTDGEGSFDRAWLDTDKDGVFDGGEQNLLLSSSSNWTFGTGSGPDSTKSTKKLDATQVDFASDAVTIKYWNINVTGLDLTGFTDDDKIAIDFEGMTDALVGDFSNRTFSSVKSIATVTTVGPHFALWSNLGHMTFVLDGVVDGGQGFYMQRDPNGAIPERYLLGVFAFDTSADLGRLDQFDVTFPTP